MMFVDSNLSQIVEFRLNLYFCGLACYLGVFCCKGWFNCFVFSKTNYVRTFLMDTRGDCLVCLSLCSLVFILNQLRKEGSK